MIHLIQKTYESQTGHKGPQAGLIGFNLPVGGTIKSIHFRAAQNVAPASVILNVRLNGVALWAGESRPVIAPGTSNVTKSGMAVACAKYDLLLLDVIQTGQSTLATPVTMIVEIEDGGVASQFSVNLTTGSLADQAYETGTISFGEAFTLEQVVRDHNCRVQLYQTAAARTADAAREIGTDPDNAGGHGIICDLNLESGEPLRWQMAPPSHGFNGDVPEQSVVYYRVQNRSGATRAINLTFIGTIERKK